MWDEIWFLILSEDRLRVCENRLLESNLDLRESELQKPEEN
jgi:hypothetical protein